MSAWKKTNDLLHKRANRSGWRGTLAAVQICQEAERLCPELVQAVSFRNGVLKLQVSPQNLLAFKLVEGKVLLDLAEFTKAQNLPAVTSIRLTRSI